MKRAAVFLIHGAIIASLGSIAHADPAQIMQIDGQMSRTAFSVVSPVPVCFSFWNAAGMTGQVIWENLDQCDASSELHIVDSGMLLSSRWPEIPTEGPAWQLISLQSELTVFVFFAEPVRLAARRNLLGPVDFDDLLITVEPVFLGGGELVELFRSGETDEGPTVPCESGVHRLVLRLETGQRMQHADFAMEISIGWQPANGVANAALSWGHVKAGFE